MLTPMTCVLPDGSITPVPEGRTFESWLDPKLTAIACIDMHRGHVGPEDHLPLPAPRARARIGRHDLFHRAARAIDVPVIHVQHWQRWGGVDDLRSAHVSGGANWRVLSVLHRTPDPLTDEHSWEGTPWLDLMVEADETRDYFIRNKKRLSAFYPTDLEFLLRQLGKRTLVLTGTLSHACVLSTAFAAADLDFRVVVPRDIVAGTSEENEEAAMRIISLHLGLVVEGIPLLDEWYARHGSALDPAIRRGWFSTGGCEKDDLRLDDENGEPANASS